MEDKNVVLFVVYLNMVLYATCYQLQRPLEPFLIDSLMDKEANTYTMGDSADEYARLQSFFSIMQTVGAVFTGYFLDRIGVRAGFILSYAAAGISYHLLSQSKSIIILYISKIPTILQAGFLCGQLAVSQVTNDGPERLTALGRLTMSYTIGSIIGPTVGGWLGGNGDYFFAARVAVAGSIISIVLTLVLLPNSDTSSSFPLTRERSYSQLSADVPVLSPTKARANDNTRILGFAKVFGIVWLLLCTKVITSLANSISASAMPLILKDTYHMNEVNLGYTLSSMSAFSAIVNGLLLGPITQLVGGNITIVIETCIFSMTGILVLQSILASPAISSMSLYNGLVEYMVLLFVLNMFQFVLATALTGESTSRIGQNSKGTLLGLEHGLFAAARVLTPQVGVTLLKFGGISSVSGVCAMVFMVVSYVWRTFRHTLILSPINNINSTNALDDLDTVKLEIKER